MLACWRTSSAFLVVKHFLQQLPISLRILDSGFWFRLTWNLPNGLLVLKDNRLKMLWNVSKFSKEKARCSVSHPIAKSLAVGWGSGRGQPMLKEFYVKILFVSSEFEKHVYTKMAKSLLSDLGLFHSHFQNSPIWINSLLWWLSLSHYTTHGCWIKYFRLAYCILSLSHLFFCIFYHLGRGDCTFFFCLCYILTKNKSRKWKNIVNRAEKNKIRWLCLWLPSLQTSWRITAALHSSHSFER